MAAGSPRTGRNASREFYKDFNAAFAAHYKKTTGKDVKVDQSHGGSSAQARAVADGLDADVVTMNTTTDVEFLAEKGVVAKDWAKRFPNNAAPTSSTMLFLVRNGNPKGIKDWDDLVKPGIQVVVVNPKTGGNGRMAYLAAWSYVRKKGGTDAQAAEFVGKLYKNVPVLARGGRDATAVFLQRNIGDVLVTFESEVLSVDKVIVLIPLFGGVHQDHLADCCQQFWRHRHAAARRVASYQLTFGAALLARGHQRGVRAAGGLGAGALPFPASACGCAGRPAVRAAHRGGRHRAHRAVLRQQRLDRQHAGAAGIKVAFTPRASSSR
jgi:accessory colonization factor AcfC